MLLENNCFQYESKEDDMTINARVEILTGDIHHEQLAPAQANRTMFTPGKITSKSLDENWPKDHRIPTSTPAFSGEAVGPVEMERSRVEKLGRNIICDQIIPTPVVLDVRVETRTEEGISGASTVKDTELFSHPVEVEKRTGYDNIKGA
jgi:hypothetical protein